MRMSEPVWLRLKPAVFGLLCAASWGCGESPEHGQDTLSGSSVPAELRALALATDPVAPPDVSNRFADQPAAAAFGHRLFFDGSLSGPLLDGDNDGSPNALGTRGDVGKVACSGCHIPSSEYSDTRSLNEQISLAAGWGKRRAPSLLDIGASKLLMWDGRHDALYNQVFGVIESPVEMNSSRLYAAQQIFALHRPEYEALFGALPPFDDVSRFPTVTAALTGCSRLDESRRICKGTVHGSPGDGAEYDQLATEDQDAVTQVVVNVGKAIGAYERLLWCGRSRFDRWALGEDPNALTAQEQRGAALFVGKAKCVDCHSGPFMSDERFHNVGLKPEVVATVFIDSPDSGARAGLSALLSDPLNVKGRFSDGDDGRIPASVEPNMETAFRTPKLRCASKRPSFMHTAQILSLDAVVAFFNGGGHRFGYMGKNELTPLDLSTDESADLVAFLRSLDGPGPAAALLSPP